MELPICNFSYSSHDLIGKSFITNVNQVIDEYFRDNRPFFAGLCYNCYVNDLIYSLQRCGGCQLVSYCSRECQKEDRSRHKYVCKEFPLIGGKNALCSTGSWRKHIAGLRERAARIPHAKSIFLNPRVCCTCREARQDRLSDCRCGTVSYCSNICSKADKQHVKYCAPLSQIGQFSMVIDKPYQLPKLSDTTVCDTFTIASCWEDILPDQYILAIQNLVEKADQQGEILLEESLKRERLSYSMSLLFALQSLPQRRLGPDSCPLEELTSLEVHIVTSIPLFDSEAWEVFLHRLPNLKQLKVVFVMQGREFRQSFGLIKNMTIQRCNNCKDNNRVVTYSVHRMLYHMFFSSAEYTEPDVVVVYGNAHEMPTSGEDGIHSEISYRNMTHSRNTVLVLMDATKDLVSQGARAVEAVQSVYKLAPPQLNPLRRPSTNRVEIDSGSDIFYEKSYFTCLKRKKMQLSFSN